MKKKSNQRPFHQAFLIATLAVTMAPVAHADEMARRWMNQALSPDERAALAVAEMTREEKQTLVFGYFATEAPWKNFKPPQDALEGSGGYVPGIPRLGIPAQWETDAGLGVATQGGAKQKRERTALPSGLATAASWDPEVARRGGTMIGAEARASGFNVILSGSVNLVREPRNGRNFEYAGEDPLLAGIMTAEQILGIESNHIISTTKHFALNDQETERNSLNVIIDPAQARMSDLLAFQIAIERADPGSVMCSYNKVWGEHACENTALLRDILRRDWGWRGYVMSDWGATHSTAKAALAGLDQQSGNPFDDKPYFGKPLLDAVQRGELPESRLTEMTHRIVRTMFAKGLVDHPMKSHPMELSSADLKAHAEVTRRGAEAGAVLLKNDGGLLPLRADIKRIAVIGGHADQGVLAGGGSSLVYPVGGNAVPGLKPTGWPGPVMYYPSSPLRALQALSPQTQVQFATGADRGAAAKLAAGSDVALVFVTQWTTESEDASLVLADGQDALVEAVARANPRTVVILETGGAVFMPWIAKVPAALEVWYPGTSGGEAIANLLFGKVDPSGRLPVSFPRDASQFARAELVEKGGNGDVHYAEGAAVGYKWYDSRKLEPLFPFGHGLTYSKFEYSELEVGLDGEWVNVKFAVKNVGGRAGRDVPQVYASPAAGGWEAPKRLATWSKVHLEPGEMSRLSLRVDPRLLAVFDAKTNEWRIAAGHYGFKLGASAADMKLERSIELAARTWASRRP
ncbi:MAG TPA: beta-glucosidase [Steroidobacteraceae bacterium]|nr:beta-glucosidase [Steroidobacteraceae bacterium]